MTELRQNIDWVGAVDWNVRDFHGYNTHRGSTYNAYLVRDEKNVLIDTVKAPFAGELLQNIRRLTALTSIDYVVCNHSELDHAGALPAVMKELPNATLVCNAKCRETLSGYFDISNWRFQIVEPGETLPLGLRSLSFINVPMVHWPESMMTWLPEEKILFSNDAFGQHLATSVRFDDQWPLANILTEAKSYYANIVTPYGKQVLKTLDAASTLPISIIAPSHGLIWRKELASIVAAYKDWASGRFQPKISILYDTMWESTGMMADEIARGALSVSGALDVQPMHVRKTSMTRIATEMLDAPVVAFGSSTLNTEMMPAMSAILTYLKGLKFRAKTAFAFGSAGWGPGGPEAVDRLIDVMKYERLRPVIKAKWRPGPEVLSDCFEAGRDLARLALQRVEQDR